MEKIIDIHAHISNHELYGLHTKTATLDDLRRLAARYGIEKIFLMPTYFPLKKSGMPNLAILEKIKGDPLFSCFGSLDLENNFTNGLAELDELAKNDRLAGIKLYPGYQNIHLEKSDYDDIYRLAEKYQLPVAIHLGELHHCCPRNQRDQKKYRCQLNRCPLDERSKLSEPGILNSIASRFPNVKLIACHLANPYFQELREAMNKHPNIYADISGQFLSGTDEDNLEYRQCLGQEIKKFLNMGSGPERLLFGTDFPIQSYADTIDLIKTLEIKSSIVENIFYDNSIKLLKK